MPNEIISRIKKLLVCPIHRTSLDCDEGFLTIDGPPWPDGRMTCPHGCRWAIRDGIPRFVSGDSYASSFGLQWKRYPRVELDSATGRSYSRQRLERCLGTALESLHEKVILECGSGAGRFTELLVQDCRALVSVDLSAAVEANLNNCRQLKPYLLLQADMNASPLPFRYFDIVICVGVVQHTPSPEATLRNLSRYVKPGGQLVIDHYTRPRGLSLRSVLWYADLAYPLRAVLRRLRPEHALRATTLLTAFCDPIRRRTCRSRAVDRIARRVLPTACYYNKYPELDPRVLYEYHQLDTFDWLTDRYKHFRTPDQIRACLEGLGLQVLNCELAGNGVEARAAAPVVAESKL
jgi:SAM-dependent methyltransferase